MNYRIVRLKGKDPVLLRYGYNCETDDHDVTLEAYTTVMDGEEKISDGIHQEVVSFRVLAAARLFISEVSDNYIEQFLSRASI